jgi:hypothetical protein
LRWQTLKLIGLRTYGADLLRLGRRMLMVGNTAQNLLYAMIKDVVDAADVVNGGATG